MYFINIYLEGVEFNPPEKKKMNKFVSNFKWELLILRKLAQNQSERTWPNNCHGIILHQKDGLFKGIYSQYSTSVYYFLSHIYLIMMIHVVSFDETGTCIWLLRITKNCILGVCGRIELFYIYTLCKKNVCKYVDSMGI